MIFCTGEVLVDVYRNNDFVNGNIPFDNTLPIKNKPLDNTLPINDNKPLSGAKDLRFLQNVFAGGAPFNVAVDIKRLFGDAFFYGAVGNDDYGDYIARFNKDCGYDFYIDRVDDFTTQAVVTVDNGERSFSFIEGAHFKLSFTTFKSLFLNLYKSDKNIVCHFGSLILSNVKGRDFFFNAAKFLKTLGVKISFDVNYREVFASQKEAVEILKQVVLLSDIVKLSEQEVTLLSNVSDCKSGAISLLKPNQEFVVTLGDKGSFYISNKDFVFCDAKKVTPIDTTGAGDAFYACFLNQYINCGNKDIHKALLIASKTAANVVLKKGALI